MPRTPIRHNLIQIILFTDNLYKKETKYQSLAGKTMSTAFSDLPEGATVSIRSFTVAIEEEQLNNFKTLLRLSKIADPTYEGSNQERKYGVTREWMIEAKDQWLHRFDW